MRHYNSAALTKGVMFRCKHFPGEYGAAMNLEKAIEHWKECRPQVIATNVEDFEVACRRN